MMKFSFRSLFWLPLIFLASCSIYVDNSGTEPINLCNSNNAQFEIYNNSSLPVDIYVYTSFQTSLSPGQSVYLQGQEGYYQFEARFPNSSVEIGSGDYLACESYYIEVGGTPSCEINNTATFRLYNNSGNNRDVYLNEVLVAQLSAGEQADFDVQGNTTAHIVSKDPLTGLSFTDIQQSIGTCEFLEVGLQ